MFSSLNNCQQNLPSTHGFSPSGFNGLTSCGLSGKDVEEAEDLYQDDGIRDQNICAAKVKGVSHRSRVQSMIEKRSTVC